MHKEPRLLRNADHRRMPWKNGGGETVEVIVHPEGASLSDFGWRVSMATVASDGPFSVFPGIDRTIVVVEGAGGLMSPIGERDYVADLAEAFGYPLIVVAPNRIGAINGTLLTLMAAASRPRPLPIAGIVLNDVLPPDHGDPAIHSNRVELELRCVPPVLCQLGHGAADFDAPVDWLGLTRSSRASA